MNTEHAFESEVQRAFHRAAMNILSVISPEAVVSHLKANDSAVSLPFEVSDYEAFHVVLDADDVTRIVLWWENEKATKDLNCRLIDCDHNAGDLKRVTSFIEGDPSKGYLPADLRTLPNKEPVAVTDDLLGQFWYLIDGSHRMIAQFRSAKSFQDVPIYVCVHPKIRSWAYIPRYYKGAR